ncbi:MAG: tetratricopeptide repeat protein [Opitutaceae bacterium]|nr:tetratricopeptide repeat protein [Opitutaceae bacterium]
MWTAGLAIAIAGILVAVYARVIDGGFVWDDNAHVTRPALRSIAGLGRIWFEPGATQQYYPLLHSTFWLEHRLWGDSTALYHLANLAQHGCAALLFAVALRQLGVRGAAWGGLLFAVHPVHVESVAWISEQKNTLSTLLYLAAALAYLRFDQTRRLPVYFSALGLFVLALLTKSVTATLPAALLVVLWWRRGRLEWRADVRPLLPWLVLGATAGLFTAWIERTMIGADGAEFQLSLLERLLLAGQVVWFYLGKLLWPAELSFIYPRWIIAPENPTHWIPLIAAIVLVAALWRLRRRTRAPLAAALFFGGTLFPVLGFLNVYPFRYSFVADHFQYVASFGLIALGAAVADRIPASWGARGQMVSLAAVAALSLASWTHAQQYRDEETLWRATLARNPECWMAHNNLGQLLANRGATDKAMSHYEAALRLRPEYAGAHNNIGLLLARMPGRLDEALAHYRRAVASDPTLAEAHNNLGAELARLPGRSQEAIAHYQRALQINPGYAQVHFNLAAELARDPNRQAEALTHYEAAVEHDPDFAAAHGNLANVLASIPARLPEAIHHYEEAIRLRPGVALVHNNLANALSQLPGQMPAAIGHYFRALEIGPPSAAVHYNLAQKLAQLPDQRNEALRHFRVATQLEPGFALAHFQLGKQLARIPGREREAVQEFETVLRLDAGFIEAQKELADLRAKMNGVDSAIRGVETRFR